MNEQGLERPFFMCQGVSLFCTMEGPGQCPGEWRGHSGGLGSS